MTKLKNLSHYYESDEVAAYFTNDDYVYHIYNVNTREDVPTIEYAEQCAKKNFGYFAGYYGDDVRKKVYDYFEAVHPVFGNRYNVTNKEAFYAGMQIALAKEKTKINK